jgi:hypothetical protein
MKAWFGSTQIGEHKLGRATMSLLNLRNESEGLFPSGVGPLLEIMTALLITFATMLVLVRLDVAAGVAPATDLDFLALAYS